MSPIIGNIGLYLFVTFGFVISILILFELSDYDVEDLKKLKHRIKLRNAQMANKISKVVKVTTEVSNYPAKPQQIVKKEVVIPAQKTVEQRIREQQETILKAKIEELKKEEESFEEEPIVKISKKDKDLALNNFEDEIVVPQTNSIIVEELEENAKLLSELEFGKTEKPKDFILPPTSFFQDSPKENKTKVNEAFIDKKIADLLDKLSMFKIDGDVVRTYTGPVVTTFEFKPAPNVKVSKILSLQDDLAMALKAQTIRIQAPIPGKDVVGIEVPNEDTQTIYLKEMLDSEIFQNSKSPLTMILGKDIVGKPFVTDLKKLPHLLIAGTTGSGKSVGINSMILSLLYKNSPDNLRLVMIDPKMLEFSMYNDIPHLLTPVITKASDAINALANMVEKWKDVIR